MRRLRNSRQLLGQILALSALISAVTLAPPRPASTEEVAPSWSYTGNLNTARLGHSVTLLRNGKVLVFGGHSGAGPIRSAELYDPSTGTWSVTGSLNVSRVGYTTMLLGNGKVLVVGGYPNSCCLEPGLVSAELYDPSTGTWTFTGSLNTPREGYTAMLLGNGKVLVAGGWANRCCLPSDLTKTAELYDPATGEWSFTGNLNVLRTAHTSTLLPNGKVLFAGGGIAGAFSATNTAELYDPAIGKWTLTGNLRGTRVYHGATLLQEGQVLVAGGCEDEECFFELASAEIIRPKQ